MFFNVPLDELDLDAQYYFNVLITEITIPFGSTVLDSGIMDYWDMSYITSPRPTILHVYRDANLNANVEFETSYIPHCVVAIDGDNRISWWDLLDFFAEDRWEINPEIELFGLDEQQEEE